MMLEMAVAELDRRLYVVEQALDNLVWAVVQGQADNGERHAVMDDCEAQAQDWLGLVQEARAGLARRLSRHEGTHQTVHDRRMDVDQLCEVLTLCQERFNRLCTLYYDETMTGRRLAAFSQLKREGGPQAEWVRGVEDAMQRCSPALAEVPAAFLVCWQRLVAHAGVMSVSVNTYAIGVEAQRGHGRSEAE
jgi:hypothetical protein